MVNHTLNSEPRIYLERKDKKNSTDWSQWRTMLSTNLTIYRKRKDKIMPIVMFINGQTTPQMDKHTPAKEKQIQKHRLVPSVLHLALKGKTAKKTRTREFLSLNLKTKVLTTQRPWVQYSD